MAERLRWWVIPGALLVLARVVTWGDAAVADMHAKAGSATSSPIEAVAFAERAVLQDASGTRTAPRDLPAAREAFVLQAPASRAGQRGELVLWLCIDGGRDPRPWLTAKVRVREDGTLPMAGLQAGTYDVELRFPDGTLTVCGACAPGSHLLLELPASTPAR